MNHTPGPWNFINNIVKAKDGLPIHHENRSTDERIANAKLIAAAPELLEAILDAKHLLDITPIVGKEELIRTIENAINKATK